MNISITLFCFIISSFVGLGVLAYASLFDPMSEELFRITIQFINQLFTLF